MKRTTLLITLFSLIFILTPQSVWAQNTSNTVDALILRTATAPTIDGDMDSTVFATAKPHPINNILYGADEWYGADDASGYWRAAWDNQNLYYYVSINDDTLTTDDPSDNFPANDDRIEIFIDGDNSKNSQDEGYDRNDAQLGFSISGDTIDVSGGSGDGITKEGIESELVTTEGSGYQLEVKIPWSAIDGADPGVGMLIGMDVQAGDDDGGGGTDTAIGWAAMTGNAFREPAIFGTARLSGDMVPTISHVSNAPVIDGDVDGVWDGLVSYSISNILYNADEVSGDADLSGKWWGLWDSENLYYLVSVNDDELTTDDPNDNFPANDDRIEIFIDGDNSKNSQDEGYDANDAQFGFSISGDTVDVSGGSGDGITKEGIESELVEIDGGYRLEVKIPWTAIDSMDVASGMLIGTDVQIGDDDDGGGTDAAAAWFATSGNAFREPAIFGTVKLSGARPRSESADTKIYYAADTPVIDGTTDDVWLDRIEREGMQPRPIDRILYGGENVTGDEDISGMWRALWTENRLYFWVDVTDDSVLTDDPDDNFPANDDRIEIYFDGDNSKNSQDVGYDENDIQYGFSVTGDTVDVGSSGFDGGKEGVKSALVRTTDGYRLEAAIPWSSVNTSPVAGERIGVEVQLGDDDDGGGTDAAIGWAATSGNAFREPAIFGTGQLSDKKAYDDPTTAVDDVAGAKEFALKGNYPNPFRQQTALQVNLPEAATVNVNVFDVMGRRVMQVDQQKMGAGVKKEIAVDASGLSAGVYLYRVRAQSVSGSTYVDTGRMVVVK